MSNNSSSKNEPPNLPGCDPPKPVVRVQSIGSVGSWSCSSRGNANIVRVKSADSAAAAAAGNNNSTATIPEITQDPTFDSMESSTNNSGGGGGNNSSEDEDFSSESCDSESNRNLRSNNDDGDDDGDCDLAIPTGETTTTSIEEGIIIDHHKHENENTAATTTNSNNKTKQQQQIIKRRTGSCENFTAALYIGTFSVVAAVLRIYMGRLFGLDCDVAEEDHGHLHTADDFLTPLSSRICVTNSGKTRQTGGALFIDLPANMLGSFVMGLISPTVHPIPWFRPDHALQNHWIFHLALRTGFCGALTTFASWNTQMVVMLDGTYTELGPQVAPALFGYIIGVACAMSSFVFGRHVYGWWRVIHPIHTTAVVVTTDEESFGGGDGHECSSSSSSRTRRKKRRRVSASTSSSSHHCCCGESFSNCWDKFSVFIGIRVSPFLFVALMLAAFFVADFVEGIQFYRKMWLSALVAPFGAVLRWKLSKLNSAKGYWKRLEWVPWGTFIANMIAVVVSVLMEAIELHYVRPGEPGYEWLVAVLPAIETGFAGSLSTVSTFVKEIVDMNSPGKQFVYCWGSLALAMLVGLLFYSPIVRS